MANSMERIVRAVAAFTLFLLLIMPIAPSPLPAADDLAIFSFQDVHAGLRGVGRTVIRGTRIEEFPFEVVGLTQGGSSKLALFRANGPLIERTGGTAGGMSGSPMYIRGRLAGALSHGFPFPGADSNLGLFTPIERMLPMLSGGAGATVPPAPFGTVRLAAPVWTGGRWIRSIEIAPNARAAAAVRSRGGPNLVMAPAALPLLASGVSPRAFRLIEGVLQTYNIEPVKTHGGVRRFAEAPLAAGAAVGVALARGDVNFFSMGTLTYRRGGQFLAYGHPVMNLGPVDYMLTTAYINTVVRSLRQPFKDGDIGSTVGTVKQDRGTGIGGVVGTVPRVFNVLAKVTDVDANRSLALGAQLMRREDFAVLLAPQVVLAAIERAWDASGAGTAEVRITARARGLPRDLERHNLFYSARDVATAAALDVPASVQLLFNNEYTSLDPIDVQVDVRLSRKRSTVSLVEAAVSSRVVQAGGRFQVRLVMRPYQEPQEMVRVVEVVVPRAFPSGPAALSISSAGVPDGVPVGSLFGARISSEPSAGRFRSLADQMAFFEDFGKNTDYLIQLTPAGLPPSDDPARRFVNFDQSAGRIVRMPYVVGGGAVLRMVVE